MSIAWTIQLAASKLPKSTDNWRHDMVAKEYAAHIYSSHSQKPCAAYTKPHGSSGVGCPQVSCNSFDIAARQINRLIYVHNNPDIYLKILSNKKCGPSPFSKITDF